MTETLTFSRRDLDVEPLTPKEAKLQLMLRKEDLAVAVDYASSGEFDGRLRANRNRNERDRLYNGHDTTIEMAGSALHNTPQ